MPGSVSIGPGGLSAEDVIRVARHGAPAALEPDAIEAMEQSAAVVAEHADAEEPAYGVSTGLVPLAHAQLISGSTATRADRTADTLEIIDREMKSLAENGPTEQELEKTKSFLKGSYGLYFDSSSKIAAQLVQIQLDHLGIDYIDRRNGMIDAVTRADAQRMAKRLLDGKMLTTVVGRPQGVTSKDLTASGSGG